MASKKNVKREAAPEAAPATYPANTLYKCPKCKNKVTVHVALVYAPACLQHAKQVTVMEVAK